MARVVLQSRDVLFVDESALAGEWEKGGLEMVRRVKSELSVVVLVKRQSEHSEVKELI